MILNDVDTHAGMIRHFCTSANRKHPPESSCDEVSYRLRIPNENAVIGCAQMEYFGKKRQNKRETAELFVEFCSGAGIGFVKKPGGCCPNYRLYVIFNKNRVERDAFLEYSNENGLYARAIRTPIMKLPPYTNCPREIVPQAEGLEDGIVTSSSSIRIH